MSLPVGQKIQKCCNSSFGSFVEYHDYFFSYLSKYTGTRSIEEFQKMICKNSREFAGAITRASLSIVFERPVLTLSKSVSNKNY